MRGYVLSPESDQDLFEIWSYLSVEASVEFANQVESELFADFELLAQNPGIGHTRRDVTSIPVLFFRAFPYQYMIIYRQKKTAIEIVAVLHAKRDIRAALRHR